KYFQLEISLQTLYAEWSELDPKFRKITQTVKDYQGIRLLKQEPIETIFAFICSSNNNLPRISSMVEALCTNYGEKIVELDGNTYYAFPEVKKLQGTEVEEKLRKLGFGYRAKFISKSAEI